MFEEKNSVVLIFTEPRCGACDSLLPEIALWQEEHSERVTIVPISRGGAEENRTKISEHKISGLLLQSDREAAEHIS